MKRCRARAVAARLDRAAVQLDEAPRQRQADAEAAVRAVAMLLELREHVEDARQHVRRDADAGVLARARCVGVRRRCALTRMRPPRSVYLAALFSRFANTCASRVEVGVDPERRVRQVQ